MEFWKWIFLVGIGLPDPLQMKSPMTLLQKLGLIAVLSCFTPYGNLFSAFVLYLVCHILSIQRN